MSSSRSGGGQQRERAGAVPRSEKAPRFNEAVFVQRELTVEEKVELKSLVKSGEFSFEETLFAVLGRPCKVSFNWDRYGDCWGCWITSPTKIGQPDCIIPGRGSRFQSAFFEAAYKLLVVFGGQFPDTPGTRPKVKAWDDDDTD